MASLVDHKAANLALVALLAEAPERRTKKEDTLVISVMSTPINVKILNTLQYCCEKVFCTQLEHLVTGGGMIVRKT